MPQFPPLDKRIGLSTNGSGQGIEPRLSIDKDRICSNAWTGHAAMHEYKWPRPDGGHPKVFNELFRELVYHLQVLMEDRGCTTRLEDGRCYPNFLIKGKKDDPQNYRLVSVASAPGRYWSRF